MVFPVVPLLCRILKALNPCQTIKGDSIYIIFLVGDGLQALAFEVLGSQDRPCAGTMVSVLARAAGMVGMVGGQALDLAAEGKDVDEAAVSAIHQAKTGALLGAAAELGAIAAGADPDQRAR